MTKCDLSREERITKYDHFLAMIDLVIKRSSFDKIRTKFSSKELGILCDNLVNDYNYIIDIIKKENN